MYDNPKNMVSLWYLSIHGGVFTLVLETALQINTDHMLQNDADNILKHIKKPHVKGDV